MSRNISNIDVKEQTQFKVHRGLKIFTFLLKEIMSSGNIKDNAGSRDRSHYKARPCSRIETSMCGLMDYRVVLQPYPLGAARFRGEGLL